MYSSYIHVTCDTCWQVEVDITMDAFKNAAAHYDSRRKHLTKHEKTVAAAEKVVKAAEKRTQQQLAKVGVVAVYTPASHPLVAFVNASPAMPLLQPVTIAASCHRFAVQQPWLRRARSFGLKSSTGLSRAKTTSC